MNFFNEIYLNFLIILDYILLVKFNGFSVNFDCDFHCFKTVNFHSLNETVNIHCLPVRGSELVETVTIHCLPVKFNWFEFRVMSRLERRG